MSSFIVKYGTSVQAPGYVEILVDDTCDLINLPTHYAPGSKAFVINENESYILTIGNERKWKLIPKYEDLKCTLPHKLIINDDENVLTISRTKTNGEIVTPPAVVGSGTNVYNEDELSIAVATLAGYDIKLSINGISPSSVTNDDGIVTSQPISYLVGMGSSITVTATTVPKISSLHSNCENLDYSGLTGDNVVTFGVDYRASLNPNTGFQLPTDISITIDGVGITEGYTYDSASGNIVIFGEYLTGDVTIAAQAVEIASESGEILTFTYDENNQNWIHITDEYEGQPYHFFACNELFPIQKTDLANGATLTYKLTVNGIDEEQVTISYRETDGSAGLPLFCYADSDLQNCCAIGRKLLSFSSSEEVPYTFQSDDVDCFMFSYAGEVSTFAFTIIQD